jgi:hypothetical protein
VVLRLAQLLERLRIFPPRPLRLDALGRGSHRCTRDPSRVLPKHRDRAGAPRGFDPRVLP